IVDGQAFAEPLDQVGQVRDVKPRDRSADALAPHHRTHGRVYDDLVKPTDQGESMERKLQQGANRQPFRNSPAALKKPPDFRENLLQISARTARSPQTGTLKIKDAMVLGKLARKLMARRSVFGEPMIAEIKNIQFLSLT